VTGKSRPQDLALLIVFYFIITGQMFLKDKIASQDNK